MQGALLRSAERLGTRFFSVMQTSGRVALLLWNVSRALFSYRLRWQLVAFQIYFIGCKSVPFVVITGAFIGAVMGAQTEFQFKNLGLSSGVGPVVAIAMCRELGPILCALLIAGRIGSAMAAELATMKITEQIDALRTLAVYPVEYLVVPRFVAMIACLPLLVGLTIGCGILSGYYVATGLLHVPSAYYIHNTLEFTHAKDVWIGLSKGLFFSVVIVLIGCVKGLNAEQGAEAVGIAATEAVVDSFVVILIANFFFTFLLNAIL
jgi:phospholipid/cholesterol/gamma-HCH transport system permease protein